MGLDFGYISEILHFLAQALLTPVAVALIALVLVTLFIVGGFVIEIFIERLHFKPQLPKLINAFRDAREQELPGIIRECGLLKRHREALLELYDNRSLPEDMLVSVADRLLKEQEDVYQRRVGRTDLMSRIAPMLGLMATLIPLGPGIVALGQGNTVELSSSLMVAFDATVTGLLVSVIALAVSKLRKRWYGNYMNALKNSINSLLYRIDEILFEKEEGLIVADVDEDGDDHV
ncbi:MAG: MotA/TolQ/ExbB proton channel family protein [Coriobacteriales bacterium]|nr:MotA/TolQ/ExbB proton channel family protein [Coriobacteriales bacterium]